MTAKDFVDFKSMSNNVTNLAIGDDWQKIMWSRIRQLFVMEKDPHAIFLATAYGGVTRRMDVYRRNRRFLETPQTAITLVKVSSTLGISQAKKTDLLSLFQPAQIPNSYRHFFDSLTVGAEVQEAEMED
ncbi:hypothetical protein PoB_006820600 [Plakobranchus ocellatus]|uniref:Uncharacterized protein n=1 Tax=Plakobranchus ocellatus TaxID=259542 RepID=A0AAV4DCQ5_9GAST|nr:hypothetical protein PoB_006820600 [Plakobranchus ocellatus]